MINMRRTISAILVGICALVSVNAQTQTLFPVTSPDGSVSLSLKLKEKSLYYEVEKNGVNVLVEAPIRFTIDVQNSAILWIYYLRIVIRQIIHILFGGAILLL